MSAIERDTYTLQIMVTKQPVRTMPQYRFVKTERRNGIRQMTLHTERC